MGMLSAKLRSVANNGHAGLSFYCPGCRDYHVIAIGGPNHLGSQWSWDGNADAPTFSPSINVVIDVPAEGGGAYPRLTIKLRREVRLSFVRAGRIEFLADCTHALAGQTVDLPDFPHDAS